MSTGWISRFPSWGEKCKPTSAEAWALLLTYCKVLLHPHTHLEARWARRGVGARQCRPSGPQPLRSACARPPSPASPAVVRGEVAVSGRAPLLPSPHTGDHNPGRATAHCTCARCSRVAPQGSLLPLLLCSAPLPLVLAPPSLLRLLRACCCCSAWARRMRYSTSEPSTC